MNYAYPLYFPQPKLFFLEYPLQAADQLLHISRANKRHTRKRQRELVRVKAWSNFMMK